MQLDAWTAEKWEARCFFVTIVTIHAITWVLHPRSVYLMLMLCGLLQNDLCKGKWDLEENYLEQNYCHVCHTRFAVFFPGSPALLHKFSIVYNSYQFWWHSSEKYKREKLPKREMEKRSTNGKNENVSSGEIILIIYLSFSNGYCKNIN